MTEKAAVKKTTKAKVAEQKPSKAKASSARPAAAKVAVQKTVTKTPAKKPAVKKAAATKSAADAMLDSVVKSAVKSVVEGSAKKAAAAKKAAPAKKAAAGNTAPARKVKEDKVAAVSAAGANATTAKPKAKAAESKSAAANSVGPESGKGRKSPKKPITDQQVTAQDATPRNEPEPPKQSIAGAAFSFTSVQEPPEHLTLRVEPNRVVAFHYRLCEVRQDGSYSPWIESSFGRQPLFYLHGHGNVVPGLEQAMAGKKAGDVLSITLEPEQAYGYRTSNELARLPIKHLHNAPPAKSLIPGVIVGVRTQQGVRNALVVKVGRFNVDVDTNHPFAGRTLHYQIEVLGVRHASPEEIAHRHVHGPGGHQH